MLATLLVIIIIAGFVLFQYSKGGIISGFIFLMAVLLGAITAFGYYELLAGYVKDFGFIGAKAYALAFLLVFVFVFAIVKEVSNKLLVPVINFAPMTDRAGGVVLGILAGYFFAGAILITIGLLPYKWNWLYGRFEDSLSNPPQASGAMLNPDGCLSGLFGLISRGSLQGTNNFAVVHADYVNQIFLNRQVGEGISPIAGEGAITIEEPGVRAAPENIVEAPKQKSEKPQPVAIEAGKTLTLVRLKVNTNALTAPESEEQAKFPLAQLRLIVKEKESARDIFAGSAQAVYPIGFLNEKGQLEQKPLETILDPAELKQDGLDFAFYVPANCAPVLVEFRQNSIEEIRPSRHTGQPPAAGQAAPAEPNTAEQQ
jgi:hypothetical protein